MVCNLILEGQIFTYSGGMKYKGVILKYFREHLKSKCASIIKALLIGALIRRNGMDLRIYIETYKYLRCT